MIVDLIIIGVIIAGAVIGRFRGLASALLNICSFILAIILSLMLYAPVENALIQNTKIDETIQSTIYSKVDISGKLKKVEIICNEHGSFFMMPTLHLRGEGCKLCNKTSLLNCERRLYQILIDNFPNEEIIKQFHDFLGRQSLDFYFPKYKIGIEYQGKQHFASVEYL